MMDGIPSSSSVGRAEICRSMPRRLRSLTGRLDSVVAAAFNVCYFQDRQSSVQASQHRGHVWTAPDWQGLSSRLQHWSEQPCVRPVCAVHMTAGHNALRGSGPGQNLAFHDAVALDCMSPSTNEATHPRCCDEGYPDEPGRASNKEGESWVIVPKSLSESTRQNRVMQ
jgi:hypothetical protein